MRMSLSSAPSAPREAIFFSEASVPSMSRSGVLHITNTCLAPPACTLLDQPVVQPLLPQPNHARNELRIHALVRHEGRDVVGISAPCRLAQHALRLHAPDVLKRRAVDRLEQFPVLPVLLDVQQDGRFLMIVFAQVPASRRA